MNATPAVIVMPGEILAKEIEARSMTRASLAYRMGISVIYITAIIDGRMEISSWVAWCLEEALGIPRSFWLNLEANYQKHLAAKQVRER
jgi:HTH-type transcriptional regulator/antitoxin HigA